MLFQYFSVWRMLPAAMPAMFIASPNKNRIILAKHEKQSHENDKRDFSQRPAPCALRSKLSAQRPALKKLFFL